MTLKVNSRILEVNLTNQEFKEFKVTKDFVKKFLGGPGFAINYLMREKAYEYEALSENNPLLFMTGLLTGTSYPCSAFYSVSARSPLTNIYGEGLSGGYFGAELSKQLSGIIFKGKADIPIYLRINDDDYELLDANDLWGLKVSETIATLQQNLGKEYRIACIGPSGEKRIPLACVMNDHYRAAGRTGMGAVMGSKNLKAIVVHSSKKIDYQEEEKFKRVTQPMFKSFKESPMAEILRTFGTNNITYFERLSDVPHKNWTLHKWREVPKISGEVVYEKYHIKNKPCHLCPFMCGREIEIKDGPYQIQNAAGVEYETTAAFGAMCLISDVEVVAYLNHLCNEMGVDTISTGCTIAFALDCYEHGIITEKDVGFPLVWGDSQAIIKLAEMMCNKEGIGEILSQGSKKASRIFGKESEEFLTDVKGLEAAMHDPRAIFPLGLQYATSNRGACHGRGYGNDQYSGFTGFNDVLKITKEKPMRERTVDDPKFARDIAITQNLAEVVNALGVCKQSMTSGSQIVDNLLKKILDVLFYLTGIKFSLNELMEVGDRIFTLKRVFNTKCGIRKKDDKLPPRLMFPLEKGLTKHKIPKIEAMLVEYYNFRSWDDDGIPTKKKLSDLELIEFC